MNRKIDLVYFLSPSKLARSLEKLNYIITVWDLCHRDDPEFPEVGSNRELEKRDFNYRAILPRATAIFVDSELGKNNLIRRYGIDEQRVHIMPFEASTTTRYCADRVPELVIDIRSKYRLDAPYIFYPAQFWPHKNHIYILEGLRSLEDLYDIKIGAVFSGSDKGNLRYIKDKATTIGLLDRIRFIGFVPNNEIPELYRQSIALVMPTYFGPTNLPPLEAFSLGVPVLYSDKAGLRDQVGNGGLLMDLSNPQTMAYNLKLLIEDKNFYSHVVRNGYDQLDRLNSVDRIGILCSVIKSYECKRKCWPTF